MLPIDWSPISGYGGESTVEERILEKVRPYVIRLYENLYGSALNLTHSVLDSVVRNVMSGNSIKCAVNQLKNKLENGLVK